MYGLTKGLVIVIGCLMVASGAYAISQPPGHFAYITNYNSGTVSFIDTDTQTVAGTTIVGTSPYGAAVGASGFTLYVTNNGGGTISLISTTSKSVYATVTGVGAPAGIVVNDAETFAYVADFGASKVHIVDLTTRTVVKSVTVGSYPAGIAMEPAGEYIYVANNGSGTVSIMNTYGLNLGTVTVGTSPYNLAVHPSGSSVWVTNLGSDTVSVINRYDWSVTTIPVGSGPRDICFNRSGTYAYVANNMADTVSVIKVATGAVVATIPVGDSPFGVSVDRSDHYLYVANYGTDNVSVIDTTTNTPVATVTVGNGPVSSGQFINASSIWVSEVSASLKAVYPEEDAKGNVKLKIATQPVNGTCYLYANYRRPVRLYCVFTNGTYVNLDSMTHISTENPKSKTEQVNMNGTGRGGVYLPTNRYFPGFASLTDGKGTLKALTAGGEVNSIALTGKITIHADTGVVGTATLRLNFSKL